MRRHRFGVVVGVLALVACGGAGEDAVPGVDGAGEAVDVAAKGGHPRWERSDLHWYATWGDAVCHEPPPGPTVKCPAEGSPCHRLGQTCGDPEQNCGSVLVCDDHDPKAGGCPI